MPSDPSGTLPLGSATQALGLPWSRSRPPWAVTSAEVDRSEVEKAIARVLTPPELVGFLRTTTEEELSRICDTNGWRLRREKE